MLKKTCQLGIPYPVKISFKREDALETFLGKYKLIDFIANAPLRKSERKMTLSVEIKEGMKMNRGVTN
jgi:hypothetical protein